MMKMVFFPQEGRTHSSSSGSSSGSSSSSISSSSRSSSSRSTRRVPLPDFFDLSFFYALPLLSSSQVPCLAPLP